MPVLLAAAAAAKLPVTIATSVPVNPAAANTNVAPVAATQTLGWFQIHAGWLTHSIAGIGIAAAIALIVLLAIQTTKQEGLSGSIGGRVESAYKGRPGAEEQLKRVTGFVAGVFVVAFVILSLTGI
ncbi:MAG: preprotein translocase subunit SecG [Candidatus Eremiobacteraeota bacterium]|nr:preprotein translocase subunit SecG [Candidatus Eremiobacteraeota bacterium]